MSHDYAAQESSPGRWVWACGTCIAVGMGAPTESWCVYEHEHATFAYARVSRP